MFSSVVAAMVIVSTVSLLLFAVAFNFHVDWLVKPVMGLTLFLYWSLTCASIFVPNISESMILIIFLLNCFALGLFLSDMLW